MTMTKFSKFVIWLFAAFACTACAERVSFEVGTLPAVEGLDTELSAVRNGSEWAIDLCVKNNSITPQTFKLYLAAEPHFRAESYMFPGTNYNGNRFGDNNASVPQGWEHNGEPWIFAYDRGSIPSCTISENEDKVFALFVSDSTPESYQSSCSMEQLEDGSFRHLIYWPVTEAPLTYSDKLKFSERYDTYLTLAPGEEFRASAIACIGKPRWPGYGFAEIFPVAWRNISHEVPSQRTLDEVMRLDKAFQDWGRRQDEHGFWYDIRLDDQTFRAGYYAKNKGLSPDGYSIEDYTKHPELNRWYKDDLEESKRLKKGEYVKDHGGELGFGCQVFQAARLSVEYGYRNNSPEDVDFGVKVFRSWLKTRTYPSGILKSNKPRKNDNRDASNMGWSISELSRLVMLLEAHGEDATEFRHAAKRIVDVVRAGVREDGALGSIWNGITGEVVNYNGDSGGFVLMGLVRYWMMSGDESLVPIIERAFDYYYTQDINHFRCFGGAMDCASIDKEGIQPFFTSAKLMYEATGEEKYLDYARKAAWYFASWLYIQNPIYDADDDFTIYNIRPAGANIVGVEHPALDEYGSLLIGEYIWLSKVDNEPLWREVAELMWRHSTQGFADENRLIWHGLERPIGSKNEAIFPSRWSKYRAGESKRGSINDHLTGWAGVYRTASILELSPEDVEWLREATRP